MRSTPFGFVRHVGGGPAEGTACIVHVLPPSQRWPRTLEQRRSQLAPGAPNLHRLPTKLENRISANGWICHNDAEGVAAAAAAMFVRRAEATSGGMAPSQLLTEVSIFCRFVRPKSEGQGSSSGTRLFGGGGGHHARGESASRWKNSNSTARALEDSR